MRQPSIPPSVRDAVRYGVVLERAAFPYNLRLRRSRLRIQIEQQALKAGMLPQQDPAGFDRLLQLDGREAPARTYVFDCGLQLALLGRELIKINGYVVHPQPGKQRLPGYPGRRGARSFQGIDEILQTRIRARGG
jgi:hypothetical protein